ncbi:MAG TPA: aminomethyltransferase family protein [Terriglobia bacterium]|nr:aminomethyltransferase family protein [Terriglobia bacterium]
MAEAVQTPLAGSHHARGAVLANYHGAAVPLRYSDPVKEHQAVRQAAGVFDFSFRAMFALTGDDRARFLHRIVSNDIKKLVPGQGTYATLLNAQGHILTDFRVYCVDDRLLIDTDADLHEKTMQSLQRYIIGDRVQIVPADCFALAIQGPESRAFLDSFLPSGLPLNNEYDHLTTDYYGMPVQVIRSTSTGEEGYEIWTQAKDIIKIWESLNGQMSTGRLMPCGSEALETLRIEAGIPRYGPDMGEDTLPLEAGLLNALSFNKGCYIGQEIVERARSRGHVNWKLCGLFVEGARLPSQGEKVLSAGKETGEVTSACVSPTIGKTIAMAYLRREVSVPGTELTLASGAAAKAAALPFYSPSAHTTGA